jgi:GTPase SAR1 family protein
MSLPSYSSANESSSEGEGFEISLNTSGKRSKTSTKTFLVLGPTGSGKTTFINHICKEEFKDMKGMSSGTKSCTTLESAEIVTSDEIEFEGEKTTYRFMDSVGFDAADVEADDIFIKMSKDLVESGSSSVNGLILVHKMERMRGGVAAEMGKVKKMFDMFDIHPEQIMLVITNSLLYGKKVQKRYSEEIKKYFTDSYNVAHFNFLDSSELSKQFKPIYQEHASREVEKAWRVLKKFDKQFNPMTYVAKKIGLEGELRKDLSVEVSEDGNSNVVKKFHRQKFRSEREKKEKHVSKTPYTPHISSSERRLETKKTPDPYSSNIQSEKESHFTALLKTGNEKQLLKELNKMH